MIVQKSQSLYLSNSGGVRISPSQSASNVKNRPRHMTTRWDGQGPSLSVSWQNTRFTTEACELRMWVRGHESCEGLKLWLFNLFWSNYGWCPLSLQVLCRCSTAFWTGTCLTVCCQPSEGPASLLNKNKEERRLQFRFSNMWHLIACTTYVRIIFQYCSVCQVLILALCSWVPSVGGQQCSR